MCPQKVLPRTAVLAAVLVAFAIANPYCRAELLWTENFESYNPSTNIDGKGTTWGHVTYPINKWEGYVVTSRAHSGAKSLCVTTLSSGYGSQWCDDIAGCPHGGLIDLSWWMYVDTAANYDPSWDVKVLGLNGSLVAEIDNHAIAGSLATLKAHTSAGWIEEPTEKVLTDQWQQVTLEVDFASSPDRYRFSAGTASWTPWLTLNNPDETCFGRVQFLNDYKGASNTVVWYDDMSASSTAPEPVPEPWSLAFVGIGAISFAALTWRRKRRCVSSE
jgi:hypothetical protein